jgi:hypothetical protein
MMLHGWSLEFISRLLTNLSKPADKRIKPMVEGLSKQQIQHVVMQLRDIKAVLDDADIIAWYAKFK